MGRILSLLLMALTGLMLTSCGPAKPPELEGAVNKGLIPVYSPSSPDPEQALAGADMSGDDGAFYAKYWDLKTEDPQDKVVAFYKKSLPQARQSTDDEGDVTFTWEGFPGAEKGEYISVLCGKGEISVHECLKLGKHKRD